MEMQLNTKPPRNNHGKYGKYRYKKCTEDCQCNKRIK